MGELWPVYDCHRRESKRWCPIIYGRASNILVSFAGGQFDRQVLRKQFSGGGSVRRLLGAQNGPLVFPLGCEMTHPYGLVICLKGKISKALRWVYFLTVSAQGNEVRLL